MKTAKDFFKEEYSEHNSMAHYPPSENRIAEIMEEYAKYYHEQQVKSVDLADVGERKPTYNDGLRKELETLKEKRDAALSSSAIRYWECEIQRVKKRIYG